MSKLSEKPTENLTARDEARPTLLSPEFSLEHRGTLLRIAHEAILSVLEHRPFATEPPLLTRLSEPRGVFTTLYLRGDRLPADLHGDRQLRGCVGYAMPIAPLYRAVAETARAAAFEDSRFLPVTKEEASRLEVSLSVLSPLFPIHPDAVEVGRHGLLISDGARRGLLLPQVSVENVWDRETFLDQTCRKAGLPPDAWRRHVTIEAFTAEVFSDADTEVPC
ncbi:MAG TPA: AmmeMemoRadiSam system protein A [Terriglobales bacterium]|nr:AmmeMemoRadiSam system protein A [Terriglobales bacterium]